VLFLAIECVDLNFMVGITVVFWSSKMEASAPTDVGLAVVASAAALKKIITLREKIAKIKKEREATARKALQK